MNKPSLGERFSYWFDNWMAKGTLALMALLGIATIVLVLVVFGLVHAVHRVFGQYPNNDPKTDPLGHPLGQPDAHARPRHHGRRHRAGPFRIFMLIITIGGLIIVASLIGIISGAFDSKVEELRKGRSRVLENDHTVILGWSSKVFPIINELCVANESRHKSAIVILADRDKVEMEDDIKAQVPRSTKGGRGSTKIIVRSGDPMNLAELEVTNLNTARSIIVLAPEDDDDPDSAVIKTTLAVTNNPKRKDGEYHIVGELQDPTNLEAARLVGHDEAHWVLANDLISRIMVQTCRQSGLSVVYSELLDFDGAEIYFSEQPSLVGKTFFDAQLAFADSMVMGIVQGGKALLNPASDTVIAAGDSLIVIAEDDDTIKLATPGTADGSVVSSTKPPEERPETTLVLGYNDSLNLMLTELDEYSTPRSRVTIVADQEQPDFPEFHEPRHHLGSQRPHQPGRARRTERAHVRPHPGAGLEQPRGAARRRQDAHHAAAPARHRRCARRRPQRRQRDARRPQPRARRGHPGRRLHRQRQAHQPDAVAGQREQAAHRGVRPAVQRAAAPRSTCAPPSST